MKNLTLTLLIILVTAFTIQAQKVGLVFSGGGSSGISHVGVLKALEEHDIPIDYVAGTSMGALIAGMYAIGMSPKEIEDMVLSPEFEQQAKGVISDEYIYYFKSKEENSSWVTLRFNRDRDSIFKTSLPTNIISPYSMDFKLMEQLAGPSAACKYNFDSLFVPYRCVAADVSKKEQVIFRGGNLAQAIRASVSYPLYLKPITVNGKLLFDGGLYNNFPADVVLEDFYPDIIIGSTVAGEMRPPDENDLFSQVKSLVMSRTEYSVICENGIIIEPIIDDVALFDFSRNKHLVDGGYAGAKEKIKEIEFAVKRRVSKEERAAKRAAFKSKMPELVFDKIYINGLNRYQAGYVRRVLRQKANEPISVSELKSKYFKLVADDKIKHIYPLAKYNSETGYYDLYLDIKRDDDLIAQFGGSFSSRSINHAFIGAEYKWLGSTAIGASANSHFGKFYTSGQVRGRFDFPLSLPFYLEAGLTISQWDYFTSIATFFEDRKASFLLQNEQSTDLTVGLPASRKGKILAGVGFARLVNEYYQSNDFTAADDPDRAIFRFITPSLSYEVNTLNRKQYASAGRRFLLKGRYVEGYESNRPGSTAPYDGTVEAVRRWFQTKLTYDNYFKSRGKLRLGVYFEAAYSSANFFANYATTTHMALAFQPIPESTTLFMQDFRSNLYAALGLKNIFQILGSLDLRIEGYAFQPYRRIIPKDEFFTAYKDEIEFPLFIGSAALVYNSPIGPVSLSFNYYQDQERPFSLLFNIGYLIFNKRALD